MHRIKRILVYTHNAIGLGHVFRTLAVMTGIRRHRADIDFMVLTGSSVPHMFLNEGLEVIKLPGVKREVDLPDQPLRPRYLSGFNLEEVFACRRRMIVLGSKGFFSQRATCCSYSASPWLISFMIS